MNAIFTNSTAQCYVFVYVVFGYDVAVVGGCQNNLLCIVLLTTALFYVFVNNDNCVWLFNCDDVADVLTTFY